MSSLHKLSISGVRSYDNRSRENLVFSRPLTIISGPNGVGKTTIIEALKYATTGDMPPNSRGGAFVHDPKMNNLRQVLGQVKLGYYNAKGQQMVVSRSMQLTEQKKSSTFKTLDGQLLLVANGEEETITSRCADLDAIVPQSLGANAAILNYVIFCHQEDSMWPLSEPSIVKKRFDEIFEASKLSKFFDTMKSMRKDFGVDIKLQQQQVEYLHQDNERAAKLMNEIEQISVKIQNLDQEAAATKVEMDTTVTRLNKLFKENKDFQKVVSELAQARNTATELESHIEVISQDLEILPESKENIEDQLANFDNGEEAMQQKATRLLEARNHATSSLAKKRESLSEMMGQRGKLESETAAFKRKKQELDDAIANVGRTYNLAASESEVVTFLDQRIESSRENYTQFRGLCRDEKQKLQDRIDTANKEKTTVENRASTLRESIASNDVEIRTLMRDIQDYASSSASSGNSKYHESILQDLTTKLDALQHDLSQGTHSAKLEASAQNIAVLRQRQTRANMDLVKASTRLDKNSQVMVQRDNLSKKRYHLGDLTDTLKSDLVALGKPGEVISQEFKELSAINEQRYNEALAKRTPLMSQHEQIKANLTMLGQEKLSLTKKIAEIVKNMDDAGIHVSGFEQSLKDVEEDLEIATQNMEQSSFSTQYYEQAKAQASESSVCILCQHKFDTSELASFLSLVSSKIASIPITKEDAAASFEETRNEAEKLRSLVADYSMWMSLSQKLPEIEASIAKLAAEESQTAKEVERLNMQVEILLKQQSDEINPLRATILELERLEKDVNQLELEISQAESSSLVDYETPQQVQDRLQHISRELDEEESNSIRYRDELQSIKEQISDYQNKITQKQLDLKNLEIQEQSIKAKRSKLEDIKKHKLDLQAHIPEYEVQVADIQTVLEELTEELEALIEKQNTKEQQLLNERSLAEKLSNSINGLFADVEEFTIRHGGEGALEQLDGEISATKSECKSIEANIEATDLEIQQNDRNLVNSRGQKRLLQDNIQLRNYESQLSALCVKISELEGQGAEAERDQFEHETSILQETLSELTSVHSLKLGQIKSWHEQKISLEQNLADDYADIYNRYFNASTELDTKQNTNDDLHKLLQSVDGAIMLYHSIKMEEINGVLDELWKDTYMGTDIDTIKIKSETESTKTRTTHNYRVVMYKGGVELDMRGRCSAGQKLLACVIIRLALAECFGQKCGLLVLDEPTTNLDVDNIQSLGHSLAKIIENRRSQKNFQLIVITHDEHFLTYLGASNFCDTFFRLHRDANQYSRIEELAVTRLG